MPILVQPMRSAARFRVFENPDSACAQVAAEIAQLIRERSALGRTVVLGLATGKTPLPLYEELVYLHREEGLSFQNVVTFNLDEYLGLEPSHPAGFRSVMQRNLFDHVDIPPQNIHFLPGDIPDREIAARCAAYEKEITRAGRIDFQIVGIGRNGHIGLNEPGSRLNSRTRQVELCELTRGDAAEEFKGIENVPTHAVTMGCRTILASRKLVLLAWSAKKAPVVRKAIEGPVTADVSASYLKTHPAARFFLDPPAASLLKKK